MSDDRRRAMYDGFDSVTRGHSDAWVRVADEFVALAFVELSYHVFKHGFMPNYLLWHEHGEVDHTIESDGD
jgi:hypothetical protein